MGTTAMRSEKRTSFHSTALCDTDMRGTQARTSATGREDRRKYGGSRLEALGLRLRLGDGHGHLAYGDRAGRHAGGRKRMVYAGKTGETIQGVATDGRRSWRG